MPGGTSVALMYAFLMGFYDRIEAENLGGFSEFPVLFGLGAGYFTTRRCCESFGQSTHQRVM